MPSSNHLDQLEERLNKVQDELNDIVVELIRRHEDGPEITAAIKTLRDAYSGLTHGRIHVRQASKTHP
jgi:hypothetical protein